MNAANAAFHRGSGRRTGGAMSKSPATREFARRERPLSPHLTVYRPPITMTMSIIHRITGGALYFGTLLVAVWLMAAAASEGSASTSEAAAKAPDAFNSLCTPGRAIDLAKPPLE